MAASFWKGFSSVEVGLGLVRERLQSFFKTFPPEFQADLRPLFDKEGKSLRAGFLLVSAQQQPPGPAVIDAAAAVELLHLASLIHDDVVDGAALRRKEPAFHTRVGIQKAVLYGDFLFAACFRLVSSEVSTESAQALAMVVALMAGAEIFQLKDRWIIPQSQKRCLKKTLGKTALLFSLSLYTGACEAKRSNAECLALRRAGYALGMAFQLQDDFLDWTGSEQQLGKPVLEDIKNGILTLPVHWAWKESPTKVQEKLVKVQEGLLNPKELLSEWQSWGVFKKLEALIEKYWNRAERDLQRVCGASELELWKKIIESLKNRSY